jgi:hypothetical protein
MALEYWKSGFVLPVTIHRICKIFTGPGYYYMAPWENSVTKKLGKIIDQLKSGDFLQKDSWEEKVYLALLEAGACYVEYPEYKRFWTNWSER